MTAHVVGLREMCRRLRELEDAVASQRKFVASLEARGLDATGERERLTRLLSDLDTVLAERAATDDVRAARVGAKRGFEPVDPAEEASLQAVMRDCPL